MSKSRKSRVILSSSDVAAAQQQKANGGGNGGGGGSRSSQQREAEEAETTGRLLSRLRSDPGYSALLSARCGMHIVRIIVRFF